MISAHLNIAVEPACTVSIDHSPIPLTQLAKAPPPSLNLLIYVGAKLYSSVAPVFWKRASYVFSYIITKPTTTDHFIFKMYFGFMRSSFLCFVIELCLLFSEQSVQALILHLSLLCLI